jgi:ATP-dependent Clp protease ATP-binding subunit ClpA
MPLANQLDRDLEQVLKSRAVHVAEPRDQMVQLNAVEAGAGFSKPATNVLLHRQADRTWRAFVDDDFRYLGGDPLRRRLFSGPQQDRWRELAPPEPLQGDLNRAILRMLDWLESPVRNMVPLPLRTGDARAGSPETVDPELERNGRFLSLDQLHALMIEPVPSQEETIDRIAAAVLRRQPSVCPVLCGPGGCGKSAMAATAAFRLLERGMVQKVFQLSGAAICSGAIFLPQRDERLRATLETIRDLPAATLLILEQFDLALGKSETAPSLLSEGLDRGIRTIAVARPEFSADDAEALGPSLVRRLEMVPIPPLEDVELRQILGRWLQRHPLAREVEVAAEVVPAALRLSPFCPGANPGAVLGLLETALAHAAWTQSKFLGPDELYHLLPREEKP